MGRTGRGLVKHSNGKGVLICTNLDQVLSPWLYESIPSASHHLLQRPQAEGLTSRTVLTLL